MCEGKNRQKIVTKNSRLSNIEFLRMLAMLMILIIHANMLSLTRPTSIDLANSPVQVITRYIIESFGIVGVDIFVLISGWFLIRTRAKSFLSFAFQIVFITGGVIIFFVVTGIIKPNLECIQDIIYISHRDWFVKSYIVLMIIAPVLNKFIENSSIGLQRKVIIGYFLFTCTYGWFGGASRFYLYGYGPLLFIGLYLLGKFAHVLSEESQCTKYSWLFTRSKVFDILLFFLCILINSIIGIYFLHINRQGGYSLIYAYNNPFTIIGALYLLLFFSKIKLQSNRIINLLAGGSFAAYLLHSNRYVFPYFSEGVQYIYNISYGVLCIAAILLYILLVYIASVIIDYPRLIIWNKISSKFNIK